MKTGKARTTGCPEENRGGKMQKKGRRKTRTGLTACEALVSGAEKPEYTAQLSLGRRGGAASFPEPSPGLSPIFQRGGSGQISAAELAGGVGKGL